MEKKQESISITGVSKVVEMTNIDINLLSEFIAKAKRSTFAEGSNKVESSRNNSIDFLFQEGDLTYRDSYFGSIYDIGQEIVWKKNTPVWGMNYMGGMNKDYKYLTSETFEFLKKCLKMVKPSLPFRGPEYFKEKNFEYVNKVDGDITRFSGYEKIFYNGIEIYQRVYHGGLIL